MVGRLQGKTQRVLEAVVRDYIRRARPVGSTKITERYRLDMSPATVRSIMSCLEDLGMLRQPHAASGRVPTDWGLRYYVDSLMDPKPLRKDVKEFILGRFQASPHDVGELLQEASRVLSRVSRYTSVVFAPQFSKTVFERIELLRLDAGRILMVMVSDAGVVYNRVIEEDSGLGQEELNQASGYLNRLIQGLPLEQAKRKVVEELEVERNQYRRILSRIWNLGRRALEAEGADVYVDGQSNILEYPEFADDIRKMKALLRALEEKEILLHVLEIAMEDTGLQVYIGQENRRSEMADCSLITNTYYRSGVPLGTLGVIGPKRMDYSRVIPLLEFTATAVGKQLEKIGVRGVGG